MAVDTIVHRIFGQAKSRPDAAAMFLKVGGEWTPITWSQYARDVRRAAKSLLSMDFPVGGTVSLLGFNRPEWVITNVAAMAAGGAGAGIYTTCSPPEVRYIVDHAESKVALVENEAQWKKIEQELERLPKLEWVVTMKGQGPIDHPKVLTWEQFLAKGQNVGDDELQRRLDSLEPTGLASLIYTSGTTGPPKGVMLSHENLTFTATTAQKITGMTSADQNLSYLPLSHIAEQMFTIHGPATVGGAVYFAESLEKVPDNLKEVQPTLFFGVPRIWEKFHAAISAKLAQAEGPKKRLVEWARGVASQVTELRCRGEEPSGILAAQYFLANKLVFSKLKQAIGLGRAHICVSGAAPIAKEVLEFFGSLDILVLEVYGQSEDCGPTSFNLPNRTRLGSVGPAIPGVEVKIASDGEILVRGKNVFLGYYKEPEATAETLIDGWLHSGDLGAFDDEGFLSITGRKKDIIITAGGKNIAPKNIEAALKNDRLVAEAVVIGDRRKFLSALVCLDAEAAAQLDPKTPAERLHESKAIRVHLDSVIDGINRELAKVETIKKYSVLPRMLTIDDGELTPTLKVKRNKVNESFADVIESMYAE